MPAALYKDLWLSGSMLAVLGVYVALFFIRPTGEGWGYGWNMVAFLLYASPAALLASALAGWRSGKVAGAARTLARGTVAAGLIFPVICFVALRAKT